MSLPPALVLGVDTPIGLTVLRELGEHGVPVHAVGRDARAIGGASRFATSFTVRGARPLADWLPRRIRETGARCLFAISENDLLQLAGLPAEIEGCRILTPRAGPLAVVLDKARTLDAATAIGINVPQCWQPRDPDGACPLPFPLIAKWADPTGIAPLLARAKIALLKSEQVDDNAQLRALLNRYAPVERWPLLQDFAPGVGLGQMLHMAGGRATLRFQHRRLHEWPVAGGTSTLCESVPLSEHQAQMALSEQLLASIGWEGPAMVEYRHNPANGCFILMEINGRFWGSQPLAFHCGAQFAWEQYRTAFGLPGKVVSPKHRRARFLIPDTRRLIHILRQGIGEGRVRAIRRYLWGFVDLRLRHYVWSWHDPAPLLRDLGNVVRKAWRRERHAPPS